MASDEKNTRPVMDRSMIGQVLTYQLKVRLLRYPRVNGCARRLQARLHRVWRRDVVVGSYGRLPDYIRHHVHGRSFVDVENC